jgi:DNA-binding transcriptional regulator LsrR (DeoR family)
LKPGFAWFRLVSNPRQTGKKLGLFFDDPKGTHISVDVAIRSSIRSILSPATPDDLPPCEVTMMTGQLSRYEGGQIQSNATARHGASPVQATVFSLEFPASLFRARSQG